jgi:hypothetical protein
MTFPLSHPPRMVVEEGYDAHVDVAHYRIKPSAGEARLGKKLEKVAKRALVSVGLRPY